MRRMKLVSKDMKYLIERGGLHLTQQNMRYCHIEEVSRTLCTSNIEPTFKGILLNTSVNRTHRLNVSLEDFSRISARCHFFTIWLKQVNLTLYLCDQVLHHFRDNKITCKMLYITVFDFNDEEKMTIVDRLLGATEASCLCIIKENSTECRYKKEVFQLSTVKKLKHLSLNGYCDFSDDDLSAADYKFLYLERCCLSEHGDFCYRLDLSGSLAIFPRKINEICNSGFTGGYCKRLT
uniref:F-box/LRR-repeat protein n=1 Tax=Heterorhabditis bacteriophora TaxID=37862 RepID=A0A1I7WHU0_HETBA